MFYCNSLLKKFYLKYILITFVSVFSLSAGELYAQTNGSTGDIKLLEMVVGSQKLPYGPNYRTSTTNESTIPEKALYDVEWFKKSLDEYLKGVRERGYTEKNLTIFVPKDIFSKKDKENIYAIGRKYGYKVISIKEFNSSDNEKLVNIKGKLNDAIENDMTEAEKKEFRSTLKNKFRMFSQNNSDKFVGSAKYFIALGSRAGVYTNMLAENNLDMSIYFGGLVAKNLALETFFAFFVKHWIRFNRFIEKKTGRVGVGVFNWSFGIGHQLLDRFFVNAMGVSNSSFNMAYFLDLATQELLNAGVETVRMPGINKLIRKGVLTESQAASVAIIPDFFYPLSQAALSVGSRELQHVVLSTMVALKLATGVWGELAPAQDIRILKPSSVELPPNSIPNVAKQDFYAEKASLVEFFRNPFIPLGEKTKFVRYVKNIFVNHKDIVEKYPVFKSMLSAIVEFVDNSYSLRQEWTEYVDDLDRDKLIQMSEKYLNITEEIKNAVNSEDPDVIRSLQIQLQNLLKANKKTSKILLQDTPGLGSVVWRVVEKVKAYSFFIRDIVLNMFLTDPNYKMLNKRDLSRDYERIDFLNKERWSKEDRILFNKDLLLMSKTLQMGCYKTISIFSRLF